MNPFSRSVDSPLHFCCVLLVLLMATSNIVANAQEATPDLNESAFSISVWPDFAPGETTKEIGTKLPPRDGNGSITRIEQITSPTMAALAPQNPNGVGIVVLPGGGFKYSVPDLEGTGAAPFLNDLGVTVFVLNYRVSGDSSSDAWKKPVQDSQRAIRWVRANAARYKLDPDKIGLLGFSAGGQAAAAHLTATMASYESIDQVDEQSFSPNFGMLIYPWQLEGPDKKLRPMIRVTKDTPPTFIVSTDDDPAAVSTGAAKLYIDLKENGVVSELHIYRSGGHGYGTTRRPGSVIHKWPQAASDWLRLEVLSEL